jgi:hypothetical protein
MTRRAAVAIAFALLLASCGRVGPPVRTRPAPPAPSGASVAPPGASATPAEADESDKEKP